MATTRAQWAERVREWRASGLTAQNFATREGCSAATLYWWSSHLGKEKRIPLGFVEVKLPPPAGRIEIVLRAGLRIEVSGEVDTELLRRIVTLLETR